MPNVKHYLYTRDQHWDGRNLTPLSYLARSNRPGKGDNLDHLFAVAERGWVKDDYIEEVGIL